MGPCREPAVTCFQRPACRTEASDTAAAGMTQIKHCVAEAPPLEARASVLRHVLSPAASPGRLSISAVAFSVASSSAPCALAITAATFFDRSPDRAPYPAPSAGELPLQACLRLLAWAHVTQTTSQCVPSNMFSMGGTVPCCIKSLQLYVPATPVRTP